MDCNEGFCWRNVVDLCKYVGENCINNWQELISGLITNQAAIIQHIAPKIDAVAGFPACSRVHLNTTTCAYTSTAGTNTIPIGIHMFGGRIAPDGQVSCVTASGSLPTCGTFLNSSLVASDTNRAFVMLENATGNGCARAMRISSEVRPDWAENLISENDIVPDGTVSDFGPVTVPHNGWYSIRQGIAITGDTGSSFEMGLLINGAPIGAQLGETLDANGYHNGDTLLLQLNAGDTVGYRIISENGQLIINSSGLSFLYQGDF